MYPAPGLNHAPKPLRVAIVSYFAPPQPAVASHRVLRLSRALLAAGHEVHWVTLDETRLLERDETLAQLAPVQIVRHGLGGPTLNSRPAARNLPEKVLRTLYHKLPSWFAVPDRHIEWMLRLKRHLPRLAVEQGFDVVLMTCGPHGQILSIPALRRAAPNTRIVVDYRDLLSGNAWTSAAGPRVQRRMQHKERALLSLADAVFVNSEEAHRSFATHIGELPCPVQVMRNAADFALVHEVESGSLETPLDEGANLGFFGTIFSRRRMAPVLAALEKLPDPVLAKTTLHVYSGAADSQQLLVEDLANVRSEVRARVHQHGHLPFAEALQAMRAMSALVLVNGREDEDNIFVPGKLYDYLMARRPVLFVGKQGDAWRIVEQTSGPDHCFTYDQPAELATAIEALQDRPADREPAEAYGPERTFAPLLMMLAE